MSELETGISDLKTFEKRIDYLEEINNSMLDSLELMLSVGERLSQTRIDWNVTDILNETKMQLKQLIPFRIVAFSLLEESDYDFILTDCDPLTEKPVIQQEIDSHISSGGFAWALRHNSAVMLPAEYFPECKVVFHTLSNKANLLGMFTGIIGERDAHLKDAHLDLFSIVLFHCANAIENSELYEKLRQREMKARALLNAQRDIAILLNVEGVVTNANEAAQKETGKRIEDIRGKHLKELFSPEMVKLRESQIKSVIKSGNPIRCEENYGDRWFDSVVYPVFDAKDNVRELAVYSRDITDSVRAGQHRRKLEHRLMLQSRLSSIGLLVAGIGHNLRGPLTSMLAQIDLLKMEHPELKDLDMLKDMGHKMNQIIETMLVKSRREQETEKKPLNLNELLKTELQFLMGDLNFKHKVDKHYDFQKDLPTISGIYSDFSQGLMNLINNALDAMYDSKEKKLGVKTWLDKDFIYVQISDTGCGIEPENIPKLFNPFFTTKPIQSAADTDMPRGTGLGLYSAYQILEPYGATFDVKSKVGVGTTFTVSIPLHK